MRGMWKKSFPAEEGFTLLEVLIALAILSLTLVTLLKVYGQNIEMEMKARDMTIAAIIAREKMERIQLGEEAFSEDMEAGSDERYPGLYWDIKSVDTPLPGVKEVSVRVYTGAVKEERHDLIMLTTYVAK